MNIILFDLKVPGVYHHKLINQLGTLVVKSPAKCLLSKMSLNKFNAITVTRLTQNMQVLYSICFQYLNNVEWML